MASSELSPSKPVINLTITVDNADESHKENEAAKANGNGVHPKKSRFKVARVNSESEAAKHSPKPDKNVGFVEVAEGEPPPGPQTPDSNQRSVSYDTHNQRTFAHNTLETLPHVDHYRNLLSTTGVIRKRPTLLELHDMAEKPAITPTERLLDDAENGHSKSVPVGATEEDKPPEAAVKFGWIKGVLVRCLLNIYGVMLFLRLSWCVGQAGIGLCIVVILLAATVTTITALSMSAICTNGDIKGGGAYFMISRSLGPEFGGAIGLIFSMANAVAVAMYVVGFAETIRDILKANSLLMVDEINDVRIIGIITIIVLLGIAMAGMEWEAKAQIFLLAILLVAIANFAIGSFLPPSEYRQAHGMVGYRGEIFVENFSADFRDGESFFSVFAIFFPAATGILAGANISGDLHNAQTAIPKGTLLAILLSTITYILMAVMAGSCVVRDALGFPGDALAAVGNASGMVEVGNVSAQMYVLATEPVVQIEVQSSTNASTLSGTNAFIASGNCTGLDCAYGLMNDMQVMQLVSAWGPITIAGIISATLSSALASLVSAPKVFQAVCKDKLFPGIYVFAKGYGKSEEPLRAYVLAFIIALGCICIGQLNAIAPLISNFFLMSYALINYSCFDASLAKSPGWRPAFKYYSMWIALLGAVLCLGVMFVINWWTALITFAIVCVLYVYTHYRKPDVNWGSSRQAHVYRSALTSTLQLVSVLEHVKNFRPQLLVLSGFPGDRPALVDFASNISKNVSLMVCGHVIKGESNSLKDTRRSSKLAYAWLYKRKSKAFYTAVTADNLRQGAQALMQCCGVGKMKPNTLIIGFKHNWQDDDPAEVDHYFHIIHDAFNVNFGVGMLRVEEGLDFSHLAHVIDQEFIRAASSELSLKDEKDSKEATPPPALPEGFVDPSGLELNDEVKISIGGGRGGGGDLLQPPPSSHHPQNTLHVQPCSSHSSQENVSREYSGSEDEREDIPRSLQDFTQQEKESMMNKEVLKNINRFHRKQKKGWIDVWWLFDDGGLTLLIPYLLSTKSMWKGCKLRVFMAGTKKMELDRDQRHMATLLSKFRIEYSSMTVIHDMGKRPQDESMKEFQTLVKNWMLDTEKGETPQTHPWKISQDELQSQKDKTNRHIRLQELLQQYSQDSTLIVMTLPMPRKGLCSAGLYMAWIETITKNMPPILLLRGNQQSVLTYYS